MKFERRPIDHTNDAILAHNISDQNGKRILRKGTLISQPEIEILQSLGRDSVYVADLEPGDVGEAEAARNTAELIQGDHIRLVGAVTGRTNLLSLKSGVLHVDANRLNELNTLPGVTLSTLRNRSVVPERQMVASIKIIPYGISGATMRNIEEIASAGPIVTIKALESRRVHLMFLGAAAIMNNLERDFRAPLEQRVNTLGSSLTAIHKVSTDREDPVEIIIQELEAIPADDIDLLILAGETAIMDPRDVIPTAIEHAGGQVEVTGAPVDPGNLLMIAYLGDLPILGAPGCARSPKENIVDWVLPRLLSGERIERADVIKLGHGGLLEDIKERPFPRSKAGSESNA